MICRYKNISISESNYKTLKTMGQAGDSFNDVISDILTKLRGPGLEEVHVHGARHVTK